MAKMLKELNWIEELLPPTFNRKSMFGGFSYYQNEILYLLIFEHSGDRSYKNQVYAFDIWNGCMFPAEKEHHQILKNKFTFLINHPVLNKWLYLPIQSENFEENVRVVLRDIRKENSLFGTVSNKKKLKNKISISPTKEKINLRQPQMFSEELTKDKIKSAKKISDLKNLGPATEQQFKKAGINTVAQFLKLGWKKSLIKLVAINPKNCHSIFTYALIGALKNKEWHRLSEVEKQEAIKFTRSLRPQKTKKRR